MREAGFLEKRPNSIGYWLSDRVPGLAAGYRSDAWVSQMAEPALEKLTACGTVREGDRVVVFQTGSPWNYLDA